MQSYRDLRVWQYAMDFVEEVLTRRFPTEERYGLQAQLRHAAVSIPSNIAEGWGRSSTGEYVQFLKVARGSLYEAETQLLIAERCGYLDREDLVPLLQLSTALGKMLLGLIRSLRSR